jgi:glycosyltransferase involved in cell wall biosynthesis
MSEKNQIRLMMILDLDARKWGGTESALLKMVTAIRESEGQTCIMFRGADPEVAKVFQENGAILMALGKTRWAQARALAWSILKFKPTVVSVQFFPIFHWVAPWLRLFSDAQILVIDDHSGNGVRRTGWRKFAYQRAHRLRARFAFRHLAVSDFVRHRLIQRAGLNAEDVVRVHNGVRPPAVLTSPQTAQGPVPDVFCAAHLIEAKGVHVLLDACSKLKSRGLKPHVQIAGEGPWRQRLEKMAILAGLNVDFLGLCNDVPERMARANVVVVPSLWAEAFGFTVAEAMMAGSCVVASRTGGIPELVTSGSSGVLVQPNDSEELSLALEPLLLDPCARLLLGQRAKQRAEKHFSLQHMVFQLRTHIDEAHNETIRRRTWFAPRLPADSVAK